MNKRQVIKKIRTSAKAKNVAWGLDRQGANHEVWKLDDLTIPIPRHNEIAEGTATAIFKQCEPKLGEGWWR